MKLKKKKNTYIRKKLKIEKTQKKKKKKKNTYNKAGGPHPQINFANSNSTILGFFTTLQIYWSLELRYSIVSHLSS